MNLDLVWLLLGIALVGYTFRKIEVKYRKRQKGEKLEGDIRAWKVNTMRQLKALKVYDENGYVRETKEVIIAFNQKVDLEIERVLEMTDKKEEEDIQVIFQEGESLQNRMKTSHQTIDNLLHTLENQLRYVTDFLENTHFYPPQFALDNNKLSGMIVEIKDRRHRNPFLEIKHYQTFGESLVKQVEVFQKKHREVTTLIEEIEQKWGDYPESRKQEVLEKKQQLFLTLHKGEIEEVDQQKKNLRTYMD